MQQVRAIKNWEENVLTGSTHVINMWKENFGEPQRAQSTRGGCYRAGGSKDE